MDGVFYKNIETIIRREIFGIAKDVLSELAIQE